jgi:hypothetical protein
VRRRRTRASRSLLELSRRWFPIESVVLGHPVLQFLRSALPRLFTSRSAFTGSIDSFALRCNLSYYNFFVPTYVILNLRCCKYQLQNYVIPVFTEYIYNTLSLQLLQSSNMHFKIIVIVAAVKIFENIFTILTIVTACWNIVIVPTNVVNYENVPKYFCNSHHCNCMLECCNRAD